MSTYDNKLSEWFKQVEQLEQELKSKKQADTVPPQEESKPTVEERPQVAPRLQAESMVRESPTAVATIETEEPAPSAPAAAVPEPELPKEPAPVVEAVPEVVIDMEPVLPKDEASTELFEGEDVPPVEDFLSFLGRSRDRSVQPFEVPFDEAREARRSEPVEPLDFGTREVPYPERREEPVEDTAETADPESYEEAYEGTREVPYFKARVEPTPESRGPESIMDVPEDPVVLDLLYEGTGEPRPIHELIKPEPQPKIEPEPQVAEAPVKAQAEVAPVAKPEPQAIAQPVAAVEPKIVVKPVVVEPETNAQADDVDVQAKWDRMPHHLQTLFGNEAEEVAQNSYKTFRENRGQLIQRLLDPVISLEEAARILNVCPTTVRRYTNRGVLTHIRTAGNQRRFRLSDVLTFMESNARGEKAE